MSFSSGWVNTTDNAEWATPVKLFERLDNVYHFDLDPCSSHDNHKCDLYYTKDDDGLSKDWSGKRVFMNPPYRGIYPWIKKAAESECDVCVCVTS